MKKMKEMKKENIYLCLYKYIYIYKLKKRIQNQLDSQARIKRRDTCKKYYIRYTSVPGTNIITI